MTHLEKLAKSYEVENFFDYIIESQINGNFRQVRKLYCEMTGKDRKAFYHYAKEMGEYGEETLATLFG